MAATRATTSERPSLIFTGIAISSQTNSRHVCPRRSCDFCKGSESQYLDADQDDKSGLSIAKRGWPNFEKSGRKQHDKPGDDNQCAPPELGVTVKSCARQKDGQYNGVAENQ